MLSLALQNLVEESANRYPRTSDASLADKNLEFLEELGLTPGNTARVKIEIEMPAGCTRTITIKAE